MHPTPHPGSCTLSYPGGFAWPARADRAGRYIVCSHSATDRLTMAVVDDFGDLAPVPSADIPGASVLPLRSYRMRPARIHDDGVGE